MVIGSWECVSELIWARRLDRGERRAELRAEGIEGTWTR